MRILAYVLALWGILAAPAYAERTVFQTEKEQESRLFGFSPELALKLDPALPDHEFLALIARQTWKYFYDVADKQTGFALDNVSIHPSRKVSSYTSTTNIGLQLICIVSGYDFGFISRDEAIARVRLILTSLEKLSTWNGLFYNYYTTDTLHHTTPYVSSVDNGWLAAGLIVTKQAFPEAVGHRCRNLLAKIDFKKLYNDRLGQLSLGYEADKDELSPYHYGVLCTEPRIASYIAIAKGDVPAKHWFLLNRTLPKSWTWQQQVPAGRSKTYRGTRVFEGYYTRNNVKFVPSWGGSMFEFLMPTLVLKEQELALDGLGLNNRIVVNAQIEHALRDARYPVWGISPCAVPDDPERYAEYGVPWLGGKGYNEDGVITPHATFLALEIEPEKSLKNLRKLLKFPGIYGPYGFYDSVNVKTNTVAGKYLCLDQAMSFIALNNYLHDGAIRKRFHKEAMIRNCEYLLSEEEFF